MERLEILKPLVNLGKDENEFTRIMILKRRKDNPKLEYPEKQLKVYSFYNWDEFNKHKHRIIEICELNNARAYIRLNTQNAVQISLEMQKEIAGNLLNGCAWKNEGVWNSVSGKKGSKNWWVLDFDKEHLHFIEEFIQDLRMSFIERLHDADIDIEEVDNLYPIIKNPTQTGVHVICKPFDTRILAEYNEELKEQGIPLVVIQKDANTVLYIPEGRV